MNARTNHLRHGFERRASDGRPVTPADPRATAMCALLDEDLYDAERRALQELWQWVLALALVGACGVGLASLLLAWSQAS